MTATATAAIITTTTAAAALVKWDTSCSVELPLIIWCEARKECLSDEKETSCRKTNKAMQAMTKGVVSGHENAILYPRILDRWIVILAGKLLLMYFLKRSLRTDGGRCGQRTSKSKTSCGGHKHQLSSKWSQKRISAVGAKQLLVVLLLTWRQHHGNLK